MKKIYISLLILCAAVLAQTAMAQQLPDQHFEDWSDSYNGDAQLKNWHGSNVTQVGFKFTFMYKETGRTGSCMYVADKEVGAAGITESAPGYVALGQPWQYLESVLKVSEATAGTSGGINFTYRPDTMQVWIKRTGTNWAQEDYHLLFYSWKGTAKSSKYKGKNGKCTSHSETNEESDIRQAMDGNECGTDTKATQIAEGWVRERKQYTNWTLIKVPIYYMSNDAPSMCNVILSAGNYPNFRANSGLYVGNALYADDIELIYSSKIQQLYIGNKEWKGFNPDTEEEQTYSVGKTATDIPEIYGVRGAGKLTNTKGNTANFPGRRLTDSEMTVQYGTVDGEPTVITVKSEDGKSTTTYKIKFVTEASSNARLADIQVNGETISGFNGYIGTYNVQLPYGTTAAPTVTYTAAEDGQTVSVTQATSVTGTATVNVTAPDKKTTMTYTLNFSVAQLSDNNLIDIKVNGNSIDGFIPQQTIYKVELPLGTTTMPTVEGVSAYPAGEQTITYTAPSQIDGGQYLISVTTPGNQTPRVYKLNFKVTASSNSRLKDLQVEGYDIVFNPNSLTYYVTLPMGTTTLPNITYTAGDDYQTITTDKGGVDGVTRISVVAANGDETIYKIYFDVLKSDNSQLKDIKLDGVSLAGFDPNITSYSYALPVGVTTLPEITVVEGDEYQSVQITRGGANGVTRILVTAGDGSATLYQITFGVQLADNVALSMIYVGGVAVEGFSPEQTEYTISLPRGTTSLPAVTYDKQDEWQTVTARSGGVNGDYRITVRSQAGSTMQYILHFSVITSDNVELRSVSFDGTTYADFNPAVTEYTINLPEGVSVAPTVTYEKGDEAQRIVAYMEQNVQTIRVIAESGASRTYTFTFILQKSENALLTMIYLDGVPMAGFDSETLTYTIERTTETCPLITVAKGDPTQQVAISAPAATGDAKIVVTPEQGASNTYIITFTDPLTVDNKLLSIMADGVQLAGFSPDVTEYTVTYGNTVPVFSFVNGSADQSVTTVTNTNTVKFIVSALGRQNIYTITLVQQLSDDTQLASIALDGTPLASFSPSVTNYTIPLAAGSTLPVVTYTKKADNQQVTAGAVSSTDYELVVLAEDGSKNTYTLHFDVAKYGNPYLVSLELNGSSNILTDGVFTYTYTLDKNEEKPAITFKKGEGQTTALVGTTSMQDQLVVTAEDGTQQVYTINYVRTSVASALLKDIELYQNSEWKSIADFSSSVFGYTILLPRGTQVVPNIHPVGIEPNQVYTITYGSVGEPTTISVLGDDGIAEATYTINFLEDIATDSYLETLRFNGESLDVKQTSYVFNLPYGTTVVPDLEYEAKEGQLIEYVDAPITEPSSIVVTAENGDSRTYYFYFNVIEPEGTNVLKVIYYHYVDADDAVHNDKLENPAAGEHLINLPFGAKQFTVDSVSRNYAEQSVMLLNSGIRRESQVVVTSNRTGIADVTYTLQPVLPKFTTEGKLETLKFKGEEVPNWNPSVYNYMVNVTAQPTVADFTYTAYDGKTVTPSSINAKKKQITFAVEGGETYSVCWYYVNDTDPLDFSGNWVQAKYNGYKPSSLWTIPGDKENSYQWGIGPIKFDFKTGNEVMKSGENGVLLQTIHGASLSGSIPGIMTMGTLALNLASSGNSSSSVTETASKGYAFRNTPDSVGMYRQELAKENVTGWSFRLKMSDGSSFASASTISGSYSELNVKKYVNAAINYPTNPVARMMVTMNSAHTEKASDLSKGLGGTIYTSSVALTDMHLIYNSDLTAATVNGVNLTASNRIFTLDVADDYIGYPQFKVTGKVHDQMQVVEYMNDGEWVNGELTVRVRNYGENSTDYTDYFIVLKRNPIESLNYSKVIDAAYTEEHSGDTTYINLPFGTKRLPDFRVIPENIHQLVTVNKRDWTTTVTVQNENGDTRRDIYVFREKKTNDATLDFIAAVGLTPDYSKTTTEYTIAGTQLPDVLFGKLYEGQKVDMKQTKDKVTFVVTSEDGSKQNTYTVALDRPVVTSTAQLTQMAADGVDVRNFSADTYEYAITPAERISFTQDNATDKVVETINANQVVWNITGSTSHTYTLNLNRPQSDNTTLADILVGGDEFEEYQPFVEEYTIYADTLIDLQFVPADEYQTLAVTQTSLNRAPAVQRMPAQNSGICYSVQVIAESGNQRTYKVNYLPALSDDATLEMIYIGEQPLTGFLPEQTDYTYQLPTTSPKLAEPTVPNISYVQSDPLQTVNITVGRLGEPTIIGVMARDGITYKEYAVNITAEPSHDATLNNILVNNEPLENFKSGRTYYTVQVKGEPMAAVLDWSSADNYQTVSVSNFADGGGKTITVIAQDGVTRNDYEIELWEQSLSQDAFLKNITLDQMSFTDYAALHGVEIDAFTEKQFTYNIPMSATATMPDVMVQLKNDKQQVERLTGIRQVTYHVTAEDPASTNDYVLNFIQEKSTNALLSMIYLDGKELENFSSDVLSYNVTLPVGTYELPIVEGIKQESTQSVSPAAVNGMQATVTVTAEDLLTKNTYYINFSFSYSAADTLLTILANGEEIEGYDPHAFYYYYQLPVEERTVPLMTFEPADQYQTITVDTTHNGTLTTYFCNVTAQNGSKNVYTVVYDNKQSDNNLLQKIWVNNQELAGFDSQVFEYFYTLPYGTDKLPLVDYMEGDDYQTVDTVSNGVNGDMRFTVTAENGSSQMYTIHFSVALSSNAELVTIAVGGTPVANFEGDRQAYNIDLPYGTKDIPVITYVKAEDEQNVTITLDGNKAQVMVTAADGTQNIYTLTFRFIKSSEAHLKGITADGKMIEDFDSDVLEYSILLDYGTTEYPVMDFIKTEDEQEVTAEWRDNVLTFTVIAADGETPMEYTVTFSIAKCPYNYLTDLTIKGVTIEGFDKDTLHYSIIYPVGTPAEDMLQLSQIGYMKADASETVTIEQQAEDYAIIVTAEDGSQRAYTIDQTVLLASNSLLKDILLDGVSIRDFDSNTFEYEYEIFEGLLIPELEAIAQDTAAEVSITLGSIGDTTYIYCTAADMSESVYKVYFRYSSINTSDTPSKRDVVLKHIPGTMQYVAYTIRNNVQMALYNRMGQRIMIKEIPICDPNSAFIVEEASNYNLFYNVDDYAQGAVFEVERGEIYFYVFFENQKKKISSGKIQLR